ncbi:hypothetical protein KR50_24620 [Jeotgalibacillus campisalis]|uniref:Uncharacterized protein n=1 Tax=Jeotgalibacillus campisalis TaxID=220754 RepID=A0A0C2R9Z7_9BACL|nr:hypothetical protein KR50_24620 [Jeotgalibacillus campisalis]
MHGREKKFYKEIHIIEKSRHDFKKEEIVAAYYTYMKLKDWPISANLSS